MARTRSGRNWSIAGICGLVILMEPRAAAGQRAASPAPRKDAAYVAPRTPWGDPDLQGIWNNTSEASTPFERPKEFASRPASTDDDIRSLLQEQHRRAADPAARQRRIDVARGGNAPEHWYEHLDAAERNLRPWLVIDPPEGAIPAMVPDAQKRMDARRAAPQTDGPESMSAWVRCITRGVPDMMMPTWYNNNYQILQAPGYVAIVYEMIHETRIIPTDGRPHLPSGMRQWLGDARGRWEGSSLVVDVTNFGDQTRYRGSSRDLHLVERFTRVSPTRIDWQVTVEDPATWTQPWTLLMPLSASAGRTRIYEYACHEGNSSMTTILRGARAREQGTPLPLR